MSLANFTDVVSRLFPDGVLEASTRLTGGVSADVYRLDIKLADGTQTSVVLRAHGKSHSGHPADLEFALLKALHRSGLPVPEPLMVEPSGALLGDPFLIITFVDGNTNIPPGHELARIKTMAATLAKIHASPTHELPELPRRVDPLPEVFDFLPGGAEWQSLQEHLRRLTDTSYAGTPKLLHGDFWPENILWRNKAVAAVLDWEDAALGDPLSDVAAARVELRYKFGTKAMQQFTQAYAKHASLDHQRLALWQVYVAAAAQRYMGEWGLDPELEAHMRREALASIREAAIELN